MKGRNLLNMNGSKSRLPRLPSRWIVMDMERSTVGLNHKNTLHPVALCSVTKRRGVTRSIEDWVTGTGTILNRIPVTFGNYNQVWTQGRFLDHASGNEWL